MTGQYAVAISGKIWNFESGHTLDQLRKFVQMGNPSLSYQIVELVETPKALGLDEYRRRVSAGEL